MQTKLQAMNANHTWDLVPFPTDKKSICSKLMFKVKLKYDGKDAKLDLLPKI